MKNIKIFISSVQIEFSKERQNLYDYISTDALLGRFFEPFIFENLPALNVSAEKAYLTQVKKSDIYLGIFGKQYGKEDKEGISPTEHEYNLSCSVNKTRLIFISHQKATERHPKEQALISKIEQDVVRKKFSDISELRAAVYASLVNYLEEKEYLRTLPFDASICRNASLSDIDNEKIISFIEMAKTKRGFSLPVSTNPEKVLTHLHLLNNGSLTNAAVLLFGYQPQNHLVTAEIKCVQFHGNIIQKPIPAYQVYKGDIFQQVNQAVDFVLSRINVSVGTRETSIDAPVDYELPRFAVTEAIVNAVAHRDYTSTGGVQVMLFRDRLEIWNPGQLPQNLSLSKLKKPHGSFPANPLIAEPLFLAGYIEKIGTGILDMISSCHTLGLKEPEFRQEDVFKVILWREEIKTPQATPQVTLQATPQAEYIRRIVFVMTGDYSREKIQELLGLRDRKSFTENYLNPSINQGFIEMTLPEIPTSPKQRYRLTEEGNALQKELNQQKKK